MRRWDSASLERALAAARERNSKGIAASLSFLPVRKYRPVAIAREVQSYGEILRRIRERGLDSDITLKLHQFGIYASVERCQKAVLSVADEAAAKNTFVWIDMERKGTVTATIDIFRQCYDSYRNAGICLQAYLKRTEADLQSLLPLGAPIRLVKGFYADNEFPSWEAVGDNYAHLMEILLQSGFRPAIATHDMFLIDRACRRIRQLGRGDAELQFFNGVRKSEAESLVQQGFRVREYIPFGRHLRFLLEGLPTFDLWRFFQRLIRLKKIR